MSVFWDCFTCVRAMLCAASYPRVACGPLRFAIFSVPQVYLDLAHSFVRNVDVMLTRTGWYSAPESAQLYKNGIIDAGNPNENIVTTFDDQATNVIGSGYDGDAMVVRSVVLTVW